MAINDLTVLADVKAWLSIAAGDTSVDAVLSRLITACSMAMQAYMNRIIAVSPYSATFNGNDKDHLTVPHYPLQSVMSVSVNGVAVPAGVAPSPTQSQQTGYFFDDDTIYLYGYRFCQGVQNCSVSYTAGLPSSDPNMFVLAQACIETVGLRFKERSRIGEVSKSVNGEVISFFKGDFSPDTITVMNKLRNVVPT